MSVMRGKTKCGKGLGPNLFKNRRSAIKLHFSVVFGRTNMLQFAGLVPGSKNPSARSFCKRINVSGVQVFRRVAKSGSTVRRVAMRSSGTKVCHICEGII